MRANGRIHRVVRPERANHAIPFLDERFWNRGAPAVLTLRRHGRTLRFDDSGFTQPPWVYRPLTRGRAHEEAFCEHIRSLDLSGQYVDVGAHLGTHALWFAMLCPATHVHAFEPVARYAEVLRRNVAANDMGAKVTVHQVGLAAERGFARAWLSPEHQVGFINGDAGAGGVPGAGVVAGPPVVGRGAVVEEFPVARLDDLIRGPVAVIKLDVEGMEAAVLRGAARILSRYRPVVFAESHTEAEGELVAEVLAPYGYLPTGRVFNATPTYEYAAPPRRGRERLRPVWQWLPASLRGRIREAVALAR
jgi:FkbM family methyltransferase